jgi:hypothetical protein
MPDNTASNAEGTNQETVDAWLTAYVAAWKSYDPVAIGNLFSHDVTYRYHPYDDPVTGREAVVASWLEQRDPPGTYDAHYQAILIQGDQAAARGRSVYYEADGVSVKAEWHNLFLLRFDQAGRCTDFCEWFMRRHDNNPTS